jgi:transposase InsO family protein
MPVIRVARKLKAIDVIDVLSDLFILRGVPGYIRSDNGPEFVAQAVRDWISAAGAKTAYIERGSPWENGYIESFNARLRDELLNGEIFYTLREAQIVIESWRRHYGQAPRLYWIQATSIRGLRACIRRVAGCATPTGSAGHAGATTNLKLTFHLDHSMRWPPALGHKSRSFGRVWARLEITRCSVGGHAMARSGSSHRTPRAASGR